MWGDGLIFNNKRLIHQDVCYAIIKWELLTSKASMKSKKKEYGLFILEDSKSKACGWSKSIEEMVFILMAQVNVSSRGLLWIKGWDRKASFKRLHTFGVSKETDNDQVQEL